jgi:hypothetical protein
MIVECDQPTLGIASARVSFTISAYASTGVNVQPDIIAGSLAVWLQAAVSFFFFGVGGLSNHNCAARRVRFGILLSETICCKILAFTLFPAEMKVPALLVISLPVATCHGNPFIEKVDRIMGRNRKQDAVHFQFGYN